jgi:CDP-diacylglycerol--glycerol-3-phosphate 3-phosphatidyltransferase
MALNWPNRLTLIRILLSPVLVLFMIDGRLESRITAFVIFLIAGLTDLYDGYLARRFQWTTNLGKFLDPLADKLLVSLTLIGLVNIDLIPVWTAYLIIGRELLVTGLRSVAAYAGVLILPSKIGKWKAITQMTAIACYMLFSVLTLTSSDMEFLANFKLVSLIILLIAVLLTLISGFDYFWRNRIVVKRLMW